MKRIFWVVSLVVFLGACSLGASEVKDSELQERNGVFYIVNSEKPFTGKSISLHANKQMEHSAHYVNGKKEGLDEWWHENGQKRSEVKYENGKKEGLETKWFKTGQKTMETEYKNGKKHGRASVWNLKGRMFLDEDFKNGKFVKRYKVSDN